MSLSNILALSAFKDNYIWCVIDEEQKVFDCIDPGDAAPVIDYATKTGMTLKNILLTHHHDDHIGGVVRLIQAFPNVMAYGPEDSRIPHVNRTVKARDLLTLNNKNYEVLQNPGHTSSHISYYEPQEGWLFCGDTLFSVGCGRVFDGTLEQLHNSLLMFKQLPPTTLVFCAHEYTRQNIRFALTVEPNNSKLQEYGKKLNSQKQLCSIPSTMNLECEINPFLRTNTPEVIDYARTHGALSEDSIEVFRVLREQKNLF